jgi:hypothetical protein
MQTDILRAMQTPHQTQDLVESCVRSQLIVPVAAHRVTLLPELSAPLRLLARKCEMEESVWLAWGDGGALWFVAATQSLDLSRERGRPVLQLQVYDELGESQEAMTCVQTRDKRWQRCE